MGGRLVLYHLLQPLAPDVRLFNLLNYITFRSAAAFVTALLLSFVLGPLVIRRLSAMAVHQVVRAGVPDTHQGKGSTPTMGGVLILLATLAPVLLWARLDNRYVLYAGVAMLWMGAIGFLDDVLKLRQKRLGLKNEGLVERYKLAGQVTCGVLLATLLLVAPLNGLPAASTTLPFFKYVLVAPAAAWAAWVYVPFVTVVLTGASNAVNLTDGLDGLATGLSAVALLTFAVFAYVLGRVDTSAYLQVFYLRGAGELTVFCAAAVGACIGFLWYNANPAQVFMGDTGSLALGGALGAIAILLKSELLLLVVGAVFVAETLSVIIQRTVFKWRRRRYGLAHAQAHRVFRRAPLHHHFELSGWPEGQVVVRFWIIGVLCAIVALSTLKLR
jgi:phospho-N-acetylmuramoyl-pentapeptide-transferase